MFKTDMFSEDVNDFLGGRQVAFKNVQDWKYDNAARNKTTESKTACTALPNTNYNDLLNTKWHHSKRMLNRKLYETEATQNWARVNKLAVYVNRDMMYTETAARANALV